MRIKLPCVNGKPPKRYKRNKGKISRRRGDARRGLTHA